MAQRGSVCQGCRPLDDYLSGKSREVPCVVCDRLWCEVAFGKLGHPLTGEEHARPAVRLNASVSVDT